ncbi:hypothetical protein [Allokutzneria sp. NRRL B-24872]|uniref:hypothetical protein n=1 Tax=Allokutzneria sp. NRRL B-24872 TaxID=1137961 RepID=UPI000A39633C|nr:hypothetical protein [Allokutzneria sp. NRRL B-24872]
MPQPLGTPQWVTTWLSPARLAPYVRAAGDEALELYRWNCQTSSALFELVGWFEVAWRNAVDSSVTARRRSGQIHWLFDQAFPVQPATRAKIERAIDNVRRGGVAQPTPGQVIAELSLGFWRFTTNGYRNTMWAPYLKSAFPHAPGRPDRSLIDEQLLAIIRIRNRIAHHEPVFSRPSELRQRVDDMLRLGAWINPNAAAWWREQTTIVEVLRRRP